MKKVTFITGANSGLGFELLKIFNSEKKSLLSHARSENSKNIKQMSNHSDYQIFCDLRDYRQLKEEVSELKSKGLVVENLICNAGKSSYKVSNNDTLDNIEEGLQDNFLIAVNTINSLIELKMGLKKIVCISSICGVEEVPGAPVEYGVAKAALIAFVKLSSQKLSKQNISINSISPGNLLFEDSVWEKKMLQNPELVSLNISQNVKLNKFGNPIDVAELINFVIFSKQSFLTGSNFVIDGGQTRSW